MSKIVRNSIFTIVILILTAVSLSWGKSTARRNDPVRISTTVLSAEFADDKQAFPLSLRFAQPRLKLGQSQEIRITTVPNAELQIVTVYPTGGISNPQTLQTVADGNGRYSMKFKLDDFAYLGVFQVTVLARVNGQESRSSGRFVLQTWIQSDRTAGADGYVYPLVP